MRRIAVLAGLAWLFAGSAMADQIERACLKSDRGSGHGALCGCIQDAADLTLTASDQRLAARFFTDPDRAQKMRQSDSHADARFWKRYQNFGTTAETFCSR